MNLDLTLKLTHLEGKDANCSNFELNYTKPGVMPNSFLLKDKYTTSLKFNLVENIEYTAIKRVKITLRAFVGPISLTYVYRVDVSVPPNISRYFINWYDADYAISREVKIDPTTRQKYLNLYQEYDYV